MKAVNQSRLDQTPPYWEAVANITTRYPSPSISLEASKRADSIFSHGIIFMITLLTSSDSNFWTSEEQEDTPGFVYDEVYDEPLTKAGFSIKDSNVGLNMDFMTLSYVLRPETGRQIVTR